MVEEICSGEPVQCRTRFRDPYESGSLGVASGHVATFNDPLIDCKACKMRHHRADKLVVQFVKDNSITDVNVEAMDGEALLAYIRENKVPCPGCGKSDFTDIRKFNLMFKTHQGVTEDSASEVYLRPETAQGIFVNFPSIQRTTRRKLPFGVCQVGKSFRNEITPGNFIFRIREFEQMELEFFCKPDTDLEWFQYSAQLRTIGWSRWTSATKSLRLRDHQKEELSFYSKATTDFEYLFPFGWGELWGVADRTNYDLTQHAKHSGQDLTYFDPETNERYIPYVVEPSLGAEQRDAGPALRSAYDEEVVGADDKGKADVRDLFMRLRSGDRRRDKARVLPLVEEARARGSRKDLDAQLCEGLSWRISTTTGSIGKRYRRQDEIGTPLCVTYDFDSKEDLLCATVCDRDTME